MCATPSLRTQFNLFSPGCVRDTFLAHTIQPFLAALCARHLPCAHNPAFFHRVVCAMPSLRTQSSLFSPGCVRDTFLAHTNQPFLTGLCARCLPCAHNPAFSHRVVCATPSLRTRSNLFSPGCVRDTFLAHTIQPFFTGLCARYLPCAHNPTFFHRVVCATPSLRTQSSLFSPGCVRDAFLAHTTNQNRTKPQEDGILGLCTN